MSGRAKEEFKETCSQSRASILYPSAISSRFAPVTGCDASCSRTDEMQGGCRARRARGKRIFRGSVGGRPAFRLKLGRGFQTSDAAQAVTLDLLVERAARHVQAARGTLHVSALLL